MIPPSVIQELNRVTYCNGKDSLYLSQDNLDNFRFDIRDFHDTNYFRDSIIPVFQENKFVILSSDKNSEAKDLLFNLKQYFGEVIVQQYGKTTNGLFKIEVSEKGLTTAKTNKAQPIHTDHSFGFGFPNVVAMYCEESALRGGYTKLVRAQNVYSYLEANSQVDLENNLVEYVTRHGNYSTQNVFKNDHGNTCLYWSPFTQAVQGTEYSENTYRLINSFCQNPVNQITYKLKKGEILILDNLSILHARTEFEEASKRVLYRLWFDGISKYDLNIGF